MSQTLSNGLPEVHRHITTHNSSGQAIFSNTIHADAEWQDMSGLMNFFLGYTTKGFPVKLGTSGGEGEGDDVDVKLYKEMLESPPGLSIGGGSVLRFVDFSPNVAPIMHRTVSLDFGVVIEGSMECHLDSGEVRRMNRGDVCVQRATSHAWKNVTENGGWARMMFVLLSSEGAVVGGQKLEEVYGTMPEGVPESK